MASNKQSGSSFQIGMNYRISYDIVSGNSAQYAAMIKRLNLMIIFTQANDNLWKSKQTLNLLARNILNSMNTSLANLYKTNLPDLQRGQQSAFSDN